MFYIFGFILIVLKLTNTIDISWFWTTSPIWGTAILEGLFIFFLWKWINE